MLRRDRTYCGAATTVGVFSFFSFRLQTSSQWLYKSLFFKMRTTAASVIAGLTFAGTAYSQSCRTTTLRTTAPANGTHVALASYSYCGGTLNATAYISNDDYGGREPGSSPNGRMLILRLTRQDGRAVLHQCARPIDASICGRLGLPKQRREVSSPISRQSESEIGADSPPATLSCGAQARLSTSTASRRY